jgi:hypothetical protein
MRDWSELMRFHDTWSAAVLNEIKKIPNEVERLRLTMEVRESQSAVGDCTEYRFLPRVQ